MYFFENKFYKKKTINNWYATNENRLIEFRFRFGSCITPTTLVRRLSLRRTTTRSTGPRTTDATATFRVPTPTSWSTVCRWRKTRSRRTTKRINSSRGSWPTAARTVVTRLTLTNCRNTFRSTCTAIANPTETGVLRCSETSISFICHSKARFAPIT